MEPRETDGCVVVGVDGSGAALNAVRWAAAEAVDLNACLRIVHVAPTLAGGARIDTVLSAAENAAIGAVKSVRVQLCRMRGTPGDVLADESQRAAMVCIGAGPAQSAGYPMFGAAATALVQRAMCPVAIIRSRTNGAPQTEGVISVVLSDEPGNDEVVHQAMREGRLRRAAVRQIDCRSDSWTRRYPDVHVETVAVGAPQRYCRVGTLTDAGIGLAVVGHGDAEMLTSLTVPNCHPINGFPDCSVLLVTT